MNIAAEMLGMNEEDLSPKGKGEIPFPQSPLKKIHSV